MQLQLKRLVIENFIPPKLVSSIAKVQTCFVTSKQVTCWFPSGRRATSSSCLWWCQSGLGIPTANRRIRTTTICDEISVTCSRSTGHSSGRDIIKHKIQAVQHSSGGARYARTNNHGLCGAFHCASSAGNKSPSEFHLNLSSIKNCKYI